MVAKRNLGYLFLVLFVVIAPTAGSLGWYQITRDPNLRPLGITRESLRSFVGNFAGGVEIVAQVDWVPPRTGGFTRRHLETALTNAFGVKGVDVRIVFREGRDKTRITYVVGESRIGPFPTSRAAEGVSAAVAALNMYPEPED